jgi:phage shock protein C
MEKIIRTAYSYSDAQRIVGGVCGGISQYFNISLAFLRIIWFISIFAYGIGLGLYIILWIFLPGDDD